MPATSHTGPAPIAFFLPSVRGGGAQRVIVNLVQGIIERGIPVDVMLATAEGVFLEHLPPAARVIDLGVRRLLRSTGVQLVHFAGHGQYDPDRSEESVIKLADGPLVPRDLYRAKLGRTSRPLVFLTACEVGERGWTLTQIGGWAEAFCDVGFSGFVGPYWAVSDKVGRKAANLFYDELTRGATVGAAMRTIRRQFDDDDEFPAHPSWLAYTLHCQPNVRVELPQ